MHYYGWQSGYSTNPSTVSQNLTQSAAAVQATQSADGTMPLIIGEYGNSTSGTSPDANGTQVIQAVQASGFGAVAWAYMSGANDALLNGNGLSAFGQAVASFTAQSGSSGCPISPVVMQPTLSDSAVANATDAANTDASTAAAASSLTIDQIAALAAQGASDTSTATPVLAVAAPTGTMPAPAAVSGTTSFAVSDTYQTVTPGVGNATGTISGSGNTVAATGGIQTLTVTGAGNTITTGPYNDTITVSSAGNTIDAGGGNDTLILTYGGGSGVPVNADPAAVAPLGAVGNTFLAPAPGTGTLTIQGALAGNDRIDLTRALAGTTWNHNPATLWNYVIASATATGCTISVDGQVIVSIPGGAPAGQLGSYVTAQ
jgi:hypothetical protein